MKKLYYKLKFLLCNCWWPRLTNKLGLTRKIMWRMKFRCGILPGNEDTVITLIKTEK